MANKDDNNKDNIRPAQSPNAGDVQDNADDQLNKAQTRNEETQQDT